MQLFQIVRDRLLNPSRRVTDADQIQQSRLLSAILLVLILFGAFILAMFLQVTSTDINEPEVRGQFFCLGLTQSCMFSTGPDTSAWRRAGSSCQAA